MVGESPQPSQVLRYPGRPAFSGSPWHCLVAPRLYSYQRPDAPGDALVADLAKYPDLRWLDCLQWLPPSCLAGLCYLIDGWNGVIWGFFVSTVLLYHSTFLVNSVCHLFGSRRYQTPDGSRNNAVVAIITMGEGWHNNHHHFQRSARQGFYWWEIDISYYMLSILGVFGIVWDLREPSASKHLPTCDDH